METSEVSQAGKGSYAQQCRLVIWSDSSAHEITKTVGPLIKAASAPHMVIPIGNGSLPNLVGGDVCLGFGSKALQPLADAGLIQKGRKLGGLRGTRLEAKKNGGSFLLTWHMAQPEMDPARKPELIWDVHQAIRLYNSGSMGPILGEYKEVTSFKELITSVKLSYAATGNPIPISCDLETYGLVPFRADRWIISIGFTSTLGHADIMYFEGADDQPDGYVLSQIEWLLSSPMVSVRGANFKYDMLWMAEKWDIDDFKAVKFDTTIVGSLLDENRSNSLNLHTKIYVPDLGGYDDGFNAKYDKAKMHQVPKKEVIQYHGGDCDAAWQVAEAQKMQLMADKELTRFYVRLVHPAMMAFRKIEQRGIVVDLDEYSSLRKEVSSELEVARNALWEAIPRRLQIKHRRHNENPLRPKVLGDFLFKPGGMNLTPLMLTEKEKQPSTSVEHLESLAEHNEELQHFAELAEQHGSLTKTLDTYIDGFLKHIREDGRFHPTYLLYKGMFEAGSDDDDPSGAVSGRTSAKDPAWQTTPKHTKWAKPLRRVYKPPPGFVILKVDYSTGELRVAADIANEKVMIQAFHEGKDLHAMTAASLNAMEYEAFFDLGDVIREKLRQGGKAGNFGLLYRMSAAGFRAYAKKTYGVAMTPQQAEAFRQGFFHTYPGLAQYHIDIVMQARQHGYVRSPLGRLRRVPLINSKHNETRNRQERQAINSPIQSTLSDMGLLAISILSEMYPKLWIFGFTHDDISFYVPEAEAEAWALRIRSVMENLPLEVFEWNPKVSFPVDVEIGVKNLADTVKMVA